MGLDIVRSSRQRSTPLPSGNSMSSTARSGLSSANARRAVVTLNGFNGAETQNGSLRDGRFTLTAVASQITSGGVQLNNGSNFTFGDAQGLFRFFGDVNGDRRVDIADFGFLSLAFFSPPNYNAAFDFNGDGVIDIADFGQFSVRFFTSLP